MYASCGYLQFRSSLFREITYNLLTDNQKKEFHSRAIRFLERETRKCKACGNGYFDRILGARQDKEFLTARDKQKKTAASVSGSWDTLSTSRRTSLRSMSTYSGGSQTKKASRFDEKSVASHHSLIFGENKGDKLYNSTIGITIIKKLKRSYSLTRAFSSEDFTDCQCQLILSTTYAQLIEHCIGAGDLNKVLEAMLEYATISINTCNIPLTMKILIEALQVLRQKQKEKTENKWKLSLIRGKVYTLMGYSQLELGNFSEALGELHRALCEYGIRFPTGAGKRLRTCMNEFRQIFGFYVFPRTLMKRLDHWETVFASNLAECLSHLCTLFMVGET